MAETNIANGWFAVKRGITQHPIFHKRADRAFVWLWMLETAAYQDTRQNANGKPVEVKRGQLLTSYRQIEAATGVGVQVSRTLINLLQTEGAVNTDVSNGRMLITICNYDKYQAPRKDANNPANTALTHGQHTANTQKKQENNLNKRTPLPPKGGDVAGFEAFWAAWPLAKPAKAKAQAAFRKLTAEDRAKATEAVAEWAVNWRRQHPQASDIHPTSYLNQKRWEDEATAPTPGLRVVHSGPRIGDVRTIDGRQMEYAGNGTGWIRVYA